MSLILFLALSSSCFSRDYWNGAKEGMSKAALLKVYGELLKPYKFLNVAGKPYPEASAYTTDSPEPFCGGNFTPIFYFDDEDPKHGLVAVDVDLEKGANVNGNVGDCVLKQYTSKYGRPKQSIERPAEGYTFSGGRILLYISPNWVRITYRGGCHWWQFYKCGGFGFPL